MIGIERFLMFNPFTYTRLQRAKRFVRRACHSGAYLIVFQLLTGCVMGGTPLEHSLQAAGAPDTREVIASLAENDAAIQSFSVVGVKFVLQSPRVSESALRARSLVAYERPDRMYVNATERRTGVLVLRLAIDGDIAYLKMRSGNSYEEEVWTEEELSSQLVIPVTPREIVQEAFLPEPWATLPRREYRMTAFDETAQRATIEIGAEDDPRRVVEVQRMENESWVIVNTVYYRDGMPAAESAMSGYKDFDGIRFPTQVDLRFMEESTELSLELSRSPVFNEKLDPEWFSFPRTINE